MGREIKRVPLDFDWPLTWPNRWEGYTRSCEDDECDGDCEACERIDPPTGDGWQLWETTTEGSPTSPVFSTPEDLARWMASNDCLFAGTRPVSYESALTWITSTGWAPSMVGTSAGVVDGVTWMANTAPNT